MAGRRLSVQEHEEQAVPALGRAFRLPIPFPPEFNPSVRGRLLVEATAFSLYGDQLPALVEAAKVEGDESLLVTLLSNWEPPGSPTPHTWEFRLSDVFHDEEQRWEAEIYEDPETSAEFGIIAHRAIYSPNGTWGCMLDDMFGILGGTSAFVSVFKLEYPEWRDDLSRFIQRKAKASSRGVDVSWVPKLLGHIYGDQAPEFPSPSTL